MAAANKTDKIEIVRLAEIEVDFAWNARTDLGESSGGPDGSTGLEGLCESIKAKGQDTPVVLRKLDKGKKPYFLVAGFRRYEAIRRNAEKAGDKSPTIRAEIKVLTDAQAREINLRENTLRDDLSGPDLCYGVGKMVEADATLTDGMIAQSLGFGQPYISKMRRIWTGVLKSILNDWRQSPAKLTVDTLDGIAKKPKGEQQAAYDELKRAKENTKGERGKLAWVATAQKKGAEVGTMLARLYKAGSVEIIGDDFFGENVRILVNFKREATDNQVAKIAHAIEAAFSTERDREEAEPDEDAPKGPRKGKGKGANGAAVEASA